MKQMEYTIKVVTSEPAQTAPDRMRAALIAACMVAMASCCETPPVPKEQDKWPAESWSTAVSAKSVTVPMGLIQPTKSKLIRQKIMAVNADGLVWILMSDENDACWTNRHLWNLVRVGSRTTCGGGWKR